MCRTTKTQMAPSARPIVSQMSIVLNSPFLRHNSPHFLKVECSCWINTLAPPARSGRVLCVGYVLRMIDPGQDANGMRSLREQKVSVAHGLEELECLCMRVDATQSSVKVLCFCCDSSSIGPLGRPLTASDLHSLLCSYARFALGQSATQESGSSLRLQPSVSPQSLPTDSDRSGTLSCAPFHPESAQ